MECVTIALEFKINSSFSIIIRECFFQAKWLKVVYNCYFFFFKFSIENKFFLICLSKNVAQSGLNDVSAQKNESDPTNSDSNLNLGPEIDPSLTNGTDATVQQIDEKTEVTQTLLDECHNDFKFNGNVSVRYMENIKKTLHCEKVATNFLASAFGSVTTIKSVGKKQTINCRTVLWFLAFFGFMINYMYRININIAIVEMVGARKTSGLTSHSSECIVNAMATDNSTILQLTTVKPVCES